MRFIHTSVTWHSLVKAVLCFGSRRILGSSDHLSISGLKMCKNLQLHLQRWREARLLKVGWSPSVTRSSRSVTLWPTSSIFSKKGRLPAVSTLPIQLWSNCLNSGSKVQNLPKSQSPKPFRPGYLSLLRVRGCDLPLNKRIENFRSGSDSGGGEKGPEALANSQAGYAAAMPAMPFQIVTRVTACDTVAIGILKVMSKMGISCLQSYKARAVS